MKLTRLLLNGASRDVQRCLADAHHLHGLVLSMFPETGGTSARKQHGVLHRLELSEREGLIQLLVQSSEMADPDGLPPGFLDPRAGGDAASTTALEPLLARLAPGVRMRFRLRANPTRKIETKSAPDGTKRNGKRVPVRGDEARLAWLLRHLRAAGFDVDEDDGYVLQRPDGVARGRRKGGGVTHEAHVFEGVIRVTDGAKAREAVAHGIGPAKAYGFGLLSLAPV